MNLLVIGDAHLSVRERPEFLSGNNDPDWIVCVGDVVDAGTDAEPGHEFLSMLSEEIAPVLYVPGNHDRLVQDKLTRGQHVENIEQESVSYGGYRFVGFGSDRFNDGAELPYHEIDELIENPELVSRWVQSVAPEHSQSTADIDIEGAERLQPSLERYRDRFETLKCLLSAEDEPLILVTHVPPFNTKLDIIRSEDSPLTGLHWGSLAVRHALEQFDVQACVSGHIHQSGGVTTVGGTVAVNPGFRSAISVKLDGEEVVPANTATPFGSQPSTYG